MDPSALGFIIGRKVVTRVPVIEHYDFNRIELKNMGGAMAAAGGVALFHVEGVTPEAPDIKTAFGGEPKTTITISQEDIDSLRSKQPEQANLVVFGCPQMTYEETVALAGHFEGKRVKKPTWFCMIPEVRRRFEQTELYQKVCDAGVEVYSHCPLAALTVRIGRKMVLTPSGQSG
jgi:predicted aconitase